MSERPKTAAGLTSKPCSGLPSSPRPSHSALKMTLPTLPSRVPLPWLQHPALDLKLFDGCLTVQVRFIQQHQMPQWYRHCPSRRMVSRKASLPLYPTRLLRQCQQADASWPHSPSHISMQKENSDTGAIEGDWHNPSSRPKEKTLPAIYQQRCRVFLQTKPNRWKGLGAADLMLYAQPSDQSKQLVATLDDMGKRTIVISTLLWTGGVERFGKTGVAVKVIDQASNTSMIYMLQVRNLLCAVLSDSLMIRVSSPAQDSGSCRGTVSSCILNVSLLVHRHMVFSDRRDCNLGSLKHLIHRDG